MSAKSEALARVDRQINKSRDDAEEFGERQLHYSAADFIDWLWRLRSSIAEINEATEGEDDDRA